MIKYISLILCFSFSLLPMYLERYGKERNVIFTITDEISKRSRYKYVRCASLKKKEKADSLTRQFNADKKRSYAVRARKLKEEEEQEAHLENFNEAFRRAINRNDWGEISALFFEIKKDKICRTPMIRFLDKTDPFINYLLNIFYGDEKTLNENILKEVSRISEGSSEVNNNLFQNCCLLCCELATLGCNKTFLNNTKNTENVVVKRMWDGYIQQNDRVEFVLSKESNENLLVILINYWENEYPGEQYSMKDLIQILY